LKRNYQIPLSNARHNSLDTARSEHHKKNTQKIIQNLFPHVRTSSDAQLCSKLVCSRGDILKTIFSLQM